MAKAKSYLVVGESQRITRGPKNYDLVHGETIEIADPIDAEALVDSQLVEEAE